MSCFILSLFWPFLRSPQFRCFLLAHSVDLFITPFIGALIWDKLFVGFFLNFFFSNCSWSIVTFDLASFFDNFYVGAASAFKNNLYSHISCAVSFSLSQVCLAKGREEYDFVFGRVWLNSLHATEKISIPYPSFYFLFITLCYFSFLVLYFRQYRVFCVLQHFMQFLYFGDTRYERMRH